MLLLSLSPYSATAPRMERNLTDLLFLTKLLLLFCQMLVSQLGDINVHHVLTREQNELKQGIKVLVEGNINDIDESKNTIVSSVVTTPVQKAFNRHIRSLSCRRPKDIGKRYRNNMFGETRIRKSLTVFGEGSKVKKSLYFFFHLQTVKDMGWDLHDSIICSVFFQIED